MSNREYAPNRVVVTGLGAVSCLGGSADELWRKLVAGRSGIKRITSFDTSDCPIKVAGEVWGFDAVKRLGETWAGRGFQYCQYALAAALEALEHAGISVGTDDLTLAGVSIANAHGVGWMLMRAGQRARERYGLEDDYKALRHGWDIIQEFRRPEFDDTVCAPRMVLLMSSEAATDLVGERIGSIGPRFTVTTACVSGARAIDRAWRWLRRGQCEVVVAGGAECVIEPSGVWALNAMKALSAHEADPEGASRPFDVNRTGFVLAEGAGILVLETLDHAQQRGAPILAELVGCGGSANAYSLFAPEPDGDGPAASMNAALHSAGMRHDDVDAVFAHATATGIGDPAEAEGIRMTFKDHAHDVAVTAPKSMMGHAIGAAGALGAVACVKAIGDQVVPPTINLTEPDECIKGLHVVSGQAEERPIACVLNNAFGFGGANGSNIFKRFTG